MLDWQLCQICYPLEIKLLLLLSLLLLRACVAILLLSPIFVKDTYFMSKINYGFKIKNFYSIERGELYMCVLHFKVSEYSAKCFFFF